MKTNSLSVDDMETLKSILKKDALWTTSEVEFIVRAVNEYEGLLSKIASLEAQLNHERARHDGYVAGIKRLIAEGKVRP